MTDTDAPIVRGKLALPPFEVWIAVAAIYSGISYFIPALAASGTAQAVELEFPRLVPVWSFLYGLGGAAMLIGLLRRSPRIEGAGLHLLGSGITVSLIASLAAGAPILPTVIVQGGVAVACIVRLLVLRRL